jgi:hypothetical protein
VQSSGACGWGRQGLPAKNRASGAWLLQTKCKGCSIWIGGMGLRRGTLELSGWEVENERHVRVGGLGPKPKPSHWGSVSADKMQGMLNSDWGNVGGEGYTGFWGLGGGEQVACEGGVDWAPSQKPSHWSSVWAGGLWRAVLFELGGPILGGGMQV